jgi:CRP/FNR family cyclic AMP-dependent transcriptional regulator
MSTRHTRSRRPASDRLLELLRAPSTSVRYKPFTTVFTQGDPCDAVMYIEKGRVQLTATSQAGQQAVIGILSAGAFLGEGALAGQRRRRTTAHTMTGCTIAAVKTVDMRRRLHAESALAAWFRSHLLARHIGIEAALLEHTFNSSEIRLARALLVLARADEQEAPRYALPIISRDLLAEMSDTTRSEVDFWMNKFRQLGFLERRSQRDGGVQVHRSMLSVVLRNAVTERSEVTRVRRRSAARG